jgi:hypothetical protein
VLEALYFAARIHPDRKVLVRVGKTPAKHLPRYLPHIAKCPQHIAHNLAGSPLQHYVRIIPFRNFSDIMFINKELYHRKDVGENCSTCRRVSFTAPAVHLTNHRPLPAGPPGIHIPFTAFADSSFIIIMRYAARST